MAEIIFKKNCEYQGRNGMGKQAGLNVWKNGEAINIEPINSRRMIANCFIQIPLDQIDELIAALKTAKGEAAETTQSGQPIRVAVVIDHGRCDAIYSNVPIEAEVLEMDLSDEPEENLVEINDDYYYPYQSNLRVEDAEYVDLIFETVKERRKS